MAKTTRTFVLVLTETTDDFGEGPYTRWGYTVTRPGGEYIASMSPMESEESGIDRLRETIRSEKRWGTP